MKTLIPSDGTVIFSEPKQIDWIKFIEPMYQDFETKNGLTTAMFLNKEDYENHNKRPKRI